GRGWGEGDSLVRRLVPFAGGDREGYGASGRGRTPLRLRAGLHVGPGVAAVAQQRAGEDRGKQSTWRSGGSTHVHVVRAGRRVGRAREEGAYTPCPQASSTAHQVHRRLARGEVRGIGVG